VYLRLGLYWRKYGTLQCKEEITGDIDTDIIKSNNVDDSMSNAELMELMCLMKERANLLHMLLVS